MSNSLPVVFHILYRFDVGGLERVIANCINAFPKTEYQHVIIALTEASDFIQHIEHDVQIISLNKKPGLDWSIYKKLWKLFRQHSPQVCHSYNFSSLEYQLLAFVAGCPKRIHAEHGRDIDDPMGVNKKRNFIRKIVSFITHRYIAVSQDIEQWLVNRVNISPKKVRLIYNGIDTEQFSIKEAPADLQILKKCFVIGTVARLTTIKDQQTLVKAFALLKQRNSSNDALKLLIVGDGPCMEALVNLVAELKLEESTIFTGSRADVSELLSVIDLFALPSLSEGTPMCVLEAMACQTPVIASNVGGMPELIENNVNGLLVDVGNAEGFYSAFQFYLDNPKELKDQSQSVRKLVLEKFSQESMALQYLEEYRVTR